VPVGSAARQTECLRRLGLGQTSEETQGYQAGAEGIFPAKLRECLVEINQIVAGFVDRHHSPVQVNSLHLSASLEPTPVAGAVDQYPPHRLRRRGEKVSLAVPMSARVAPNKPHIRLVHQRCCLERLAGQLAREAMVCKATQVIVDEREQMLGGLRITSFDG
jgi:hypothetical protein